ncbi:DUF6343 family protein [Streptomyces sp. NPDC048242]|uniref:DUF6343 family protein n=1 Tax=Streptomyces sp. NPDC048242 TaxID=3155026 RepID=UPI00341A1BED
MRQRRSPENPAGVPRARSGLVGRRWERTGTEPVRARGALTLRLVLSAIGALAFLFGTVVFAVWASRSTPVTNPSAMELGVLAAICAFFAVLGLVDLVVVVRRRARERGGWPPEEDEPL